MRAAVESNMLNRRLQSLAALTTVAALGVAKPPGGHPSLLLGEKHARRCSMSFAIAARDTATTYVLGRPTADTILAGDEPILAKAPEFYRHRFRIFGQIVRADRIEGRESAAVRQVLRDHNSSEIVVVPWEYDMGCGTSPWSRSARFTAPDSNAVFFLHLRPESLWVASKPTFDALLAHLATYADGPYTYGPHSDARWAHDSTPPSNLTAAEYFDFVMALPVGYSTDSTATRMLVRWIDAHPLARYRYPSRLALARYPNSLIGRKGGAEIAADALILASIPAMIGLPPRWVGEPDSVHFRGCGYQVGSRAVGSHARPGNRSPILSVGDDRQPRLVDVAHRSSPLERPLRRLRRGSERRALLHGEPRAPIHHRIHVRDVGGWRGGVRSPLRDDPRDETMIADRMT